MQTELSALKAKALAAISEAADLERLAQLKTDFFGRKSGQLAALLKGLKNLPAAERKALGERANAVKAELEAALTEKRRVLEFAAWSGLAVQERLDITQPALPPRYRGHLHPVTQVQRDLEALFERLGFMVLDGPELESDYYNFGALNFASDHPARDIMDTLYIKGHADWLMRTHTSTMQVRALQKYGVPLAAIIPGKCFRNEATDARHEHTFYQLEGLLVDKDITFAHMKGIFQTVVDYLYGAGSQIRLMPKYYPFVEPGVRGEVICFLCKGAGCRVCKNSGWLEVMPGGLVHPHVLTAGGVDPAQYQGFAFGFGLTRLAMLKYGIDDIRLMESGDLKFLEQF